MILERAKNLNDRKQSFPLVHVSFGCNRDIIMMIIIIIIIVIIIIILIIIIIIALIIMTKFESKWI